MIFLPIALYLEYFRPDAHTLIFFASCIAIIPLAGLMGRATEQIANRAGEGIGGLLNATFGNAAELIIAIVALRAGQIEIVKASLTGSIIGNVLLVLGASFLAGGLRYTIQEFNTITARAQAQMLLVSAIAVAIPGLFHAIRPVDANANEGTISLIIAALLIALYILSLIFALRTHKHLFAGAHDAASQAHADEQWSLRRALIILGVATVLIAWLSEILVGSVEEAATAIGMSKVFVGVIIVAVIGNAAEHSTAVIAAIRNRMDLSIGIALGSSTQIALFVAPLLVFLSYAIGKTPMNLSFTLGETFAILIGALITAHVTSDGHSNWFTGALLLALYSILAVGFFHVPG
ncbi:cation transporter [Methyloceanibacter methanicus]|uniref:Ca(2+)/H(+) antiporter n=1 Tax=Methyloceanibacter methanicus TaxID=1774968 RepID=A0A1E3W5M2_9HYPH|nr:cation transporter [Methyloceanibacter methanicus]